MFLLRLSSEPLPSGGRDGAGGPSFDRPSSGPRRTRFDRRLRFRSSRVWTLTPFLRVKEQQDRAPYIGEARSPDSILTYFLSLSTSSNSASTTFSSVLVSPAPPPPAVSAPFPDAVDAEAFLYISSANL